MELDETQDSSEHYNALLLQSCIAMSERATEESSSEVDEAVPEAKRSHTKESNKRSHVLSYDDSFFDGSMSKENAASTLLDIKYNLAGISPKSLTALMNLDLDTVRCYIYIYI
jgi:hypothetical protein